MLALIIIRHSFFIAGVSINMIATQPMAFYNFLGRIAFYAEVERDACQTTCAFAVGELECERISAKEQQRVPLVMMPMAAVLNHSYCSLLTLMRLIKQACH